MLSPDAKSRPFALDVDGRQVPLYDEEDFAGLHHAGQLAAQTLDFITPFVEPGVTTEALDDRMHQFIIAQGATPATLGYKGYPKSSCISINEVVCHGIPSAKSRLKPRDIVNIDVTVILDGWFGDTSRMFIVGGQSFKQSERLVDTTYAALEAGIAAVKPGATLGDVAEAIQSLAEAHRFSVVREFTGHGIGRAFHQAPQVAHYGNAGEGLVLQPGMVFTIEPMLNAGGWRTKLKPDGWTAVTLDGKPSAQFEQQVGVTEAGCQVFTRSPAGLHRPPYR